MVDKRGRAGARAGAWRVVETFFEFYALLATLFSLRRRSLRSHRWVLVELASSLQLEASSGPNPW